MVLYMGFTGHIKILTRGDGCQALMLHPVVRGRRAVCARDMYRVRVAAGVWVWVCVPVFVSGRYIHGDAGRDENRRARAVGVDWRALSDDARGEVYMYNTHVRMYYTVGVCITKVGRTRLRCRGFRRCRRS